MGSLFINDDVSHHSAVLGSLSQPTKQDPYRYQHGFGNHHVSEAVAGAIPRNGTNIPQKHPYGLYAEHLNGTSFISSRDTVSNVWMYRVRPSVAHQILRPCMISSSEKIESCFLPLNPNVHFTPLTHTWGPLGYPDRQSSCEEKEKNVDTPQEHEHEQQEKKKKKKSSSQVNNFIQGLRTICGHGDSTLKEGLAVHLYTFDTDMTRQALVNNDGEFLIVPQRGTLDIQTELGYLRVSPGSLAVIPPGIRFSVATASFLTEEGSGSDGLSSSSSSSSSSSGYILEIFGAHFRLPELGPLGANGLAHVRDFQYPVASFDLDFDQQSDFTSTTTSSSSTTSGFNTPTSSTTTTTTSRLESPTDWTIITKLAGNFTSYTQPHTPFDVVAWHGRYAPYRYNMHHFAHLIANSDQLDPTAYTVLTAPSKWPGVSLVDFCLFGEKYAVAKNTLRIPYHHRTMATEIMGILRGKYGGSARRLEAGGLSFEQAYMAHGETYDCWMRASERELGPEVVGKDFLAFMFHVSSHVGLTKWAMESHPDIRLDKPGLWDNLRAPFIDKLTEASRALEKMRLTNDSAIQGELTALAFEVMANKRRFSLTDDDEADEVQFSSENIRL